MVGFRSKLALIGLSGFIAVFAATFAFDRPVAAYRQDCNGETDRVETSAWHTSSVVNGRVYYTHYFHRTNYSYYTAFSTQTETVVDVTVDGVHRSMSWNGATNNNYFTDTTYSHQFWLMRRYTGNFPGPSSITVYTECTRSS